MWKSQFLPILRSNDLIGFVDGTKSCPPKLVVADNEDSTKEVVNENLLLGIRKINYFYAGLMPRWQKVFLPKLLD